MAAESVLECRGLRRRFGEIVAVDGIAPQLGIRAAYTAVLLTLAAWRLRRGRTRSPLRHARKLTYGRPGQFG